MKKLKVIFITLLVSLLFVSSVFAGDCKGAKYLTKTLFDTYGFYVSDTRCLGYRIVVNVDGMPRNPDRQSSFDFITLVGALGKVYSELKFDGSTFVKINLGHTGIYFTTNVGELQKYYIKINEDASNVLLWENYITYHK